MRYDVYDIISKLYQIKLIKSYNYFNKTIFLRNLLKIAGSAFFTHKGIAKWAKMSERFRLPHLKWPQLQDWRSDLAQTKTF